MDIYTQMRIAMLEATLKLVEKGIIPANAPEVAKVRAELLAHGVISKGNG